MILLRHRMSKRNMARAQPLALEFAKVHHSDMFNASLVQHELGVRNLH